MFNKHAFKKNYGQNFLKNGKFVTKLVEALEVTENDTVMEIGPGEGIVTNNLLKLGAKVIAVEIDYSLIPNLIKRFDNSEKFEIINEDFLTVELEDTLNKFNSTLDVKTIGSLPYNISKKIIKKFIDFNLSQNKYFITRMSFIVQDEVAKEYASKAPRASLLGNYIKLYADVKKLESIPASQFYPMPGVNGAILVIEPKRNPNEDALDIYKFVRIGYSSPRKTLLRNLKNSRKWSDELLIDSFKDLGLKETIRAAELEEGKWLALFEKLNIND